MGDVTVPLPLLLAIVVYTVGITGYVARIGYQAARTKHVGTLLSFMQTAGIRLDQAEKAIAAALVDFKEHVKGRSGTIDRIWTEHEALKNRVTRIEAKLFPGAAE